MIKVKGILERLNYSQPLSLILKLFTFVRNQDTLWFVGLLFRWHQKRKYFPDAMY